MIHSKTFEMDGKAYQGIQKCGTLNWLNQILKDSRGNILNVRKMIDEALGNFKKCNIKRDLERERERERSNEEVKIDQGKLKDIHSNIKISPMMLAL